MEESSQMAMNKDITQVIAGIGIGKGVQSLIRYYVDLEVAKISLYTAAQYVKDLVTAGYLRAAAADTDDAIATAIMGVNGYTFSGYKTAGAGGNLVGTTKLTANQFTYRAAAGQKVAAWMFPSTWLSAVVGSVAVAEGATNFTKMDFTKKNEIGVAAMGASMLADGIARGVGVDGTISAPSGFDISATQPAMQYLDQSAVANLRRLSDENGRLQTELSQLRSMNRPAQVQQPVQTAAYRYNAPQPQVTVTPIGGYQPAPQPQVTITPMGGDIIPSRGAEYVKDRMHMMGIHRATGETVRNNTGLVTLSGGK
jgi:hypothetical protein